MSTKTTNNPQQVVDPSGGANQSRVRDHNQRLVLTLVQRHGSLSKAQIAVRTGLTAQTVTVIMRALEHEDLLLRGEPVRGKVGQPSVPMLLNPNGAFSFGLKIGRRSADLLLIDFVGQQRAIIRSHFPYPTTKAIRKFTLEGIEQLQQQLSSQQRKRIAGLGVSLPHELWHWADKIDAPQTTMNHWRSFDFNDEIGNATGLPVFIQNDATAACGAELVYGNGANCRDYVYFFIGTFIGGGVVLNHTLYPGVGGNAGALGSMPVRDKHGNFTQLIDHASVIKLEAMLCDDKIDPSPLWQSPHDWSELSPTLETWIENTAGYLAPAIASACSVVDFSVALIDGAFSENVRSKLVSACNRELNNLNLHGIEPPSIIEGGVGCDARVIGAACLPLFARYLLDQNVLIKVQA